MCMNTENKFANFGFVKEELDVYLNKMLLLENNVKLKKIYVREMYIDVLSENPLSSSDCFMLILRASEKNATISIEEDRIIFKKDDECKTHFVNISASKVTECFSKISDDCYEFILNVQNIYYKITIFN